MPLEKITERIVEDARREAKQIEADAKAKAKAIAEDAGRQADATKQKTTAAAARDCASIQRQVLAMAQLSSRSAVLAEKQELVEGVFAAALQRLFNMPEDEYVKLLGAMARTVAEDHQEIILSKADREKLADRLSRELNVETRGSARELPIADETREIGRGLVLRGAGIEVNLSFAVLLESVRDALEADVVQKLFEDGGGETGGEESGKGGGQ